LQHTKTKAIHMKKLNKFLFSMLALLAMAQYSQAQAPVQNVQDSISSDTHWTCDKQYLLFGYVYVTSGATLTIDAGVIIKGDKNSKGSLIIERGAKIYANGTASQPVVFTSNQAVGNRSYGDWGGLILCGNAPVNWNGNQAQVEGGPRSLYGGTDAHDNSGSLTYVRVEFAGIAFSPNNEVNGVTFCGVGDATQVHHLQVSYSGDDSYEWFGGTVNTKYLVAYRGWDDDFDTDNGYSGMNQYGMALRDPFAADQSGSKAWESDSYQTGTATGLTDTSQLTKPVFANYTVVGPLVSPTSTAYDPQFVAAAQIRRGSAISILNSLLIGYPAGILIDESQAGTYGSTIANLVSGASQIKGVGVAGIPTTNTPGPKEVFFVYNGARSLTPTTAYGDTSLYSFAPYSGPWGWFLDPANKNKIYASEQNGLRLQSPFDLSNPNFVPTSTSPIVYNAAHTFHPTLPINTDTSNNYANYNVPAFPPASSNKLQNAFFTTENYVGGFSGTGTTTDNWTQGWANWDPVNTDYSAVCSANAVQRYDADKLYLRVQPNPAVNQAMVGYRVTEETKIEITLVDMLGSVVKEIYTGNAIPGEYAYRFETSEINTGVYFVHVKTANAQQSIKLMIVK
jgi:hypothetical protein